MSPVTRFTTLQASPELLDEIRHLVDRAFDGAWTADDWEHTLGGWHVVATEAGVVVAHAAVVRRDIEAAGRSFATGYIEAVATEPSRQREGYASSVMVEVTDLVRSEYEMGALSTGAHEFYERFGWERWRGPTYVRDGSDLRRSQEEDDGVMVLRCGPSLGVDLAGPISCEARSGDDW